MMHPGGGEPGPDSHGPIYKGITWEGSARIEKFLTLERSKAGPAGKKFYADLNERHQMGIMAFGGEEKVFQQKRLK
ncbi:hypothetical protein ACFJIV_08395 [Mucilaginibacter sp. UC70_90]